MGFLSEDKDYTLLVYREEKLREPPFHENDLAKIYTFGKNAIGDTHNFTSSTEFILDFLEETVGKEHLIRYATSGNMANLLLKKTGENSYEASYHDIIQGTVAQVFDLETEEEALIDLISESLRFDELEELAKKNGILKMVYQLQTATERRISTSCKIEQGEDWNLVGFATVSKESLNQYGGVGWHELKEYAHSFLENKVTEYSDYLNQDNYRYVLQGYGETLQTVDGFYGTYEDFLKTMVKFLPEEAKDMVEGLYFVADETLHALENPEEWEEER